MSPLTITTVGHGTLDADAFAALLADAGVGRIVDVRSYPGSRRYPHFKRESMPQWLGDAGLGYQWLPALGGRRRPSPDSPNKALRNAAFRAYADHMQTDEFGGGVEELLTVAAGEPVAVMCSESVWWRCHRRLLSDHLVLVEGVSIEHLFHDGRKSDHPVTDGARRSGDHVLYDAGSAPLPV